jgi:uncharacterized protein YyaL (SSP411 family)
MGACFIKEQNSIVTNRLSKSTSPYLLQHAANPVDWWEWSDEAFAQARLRDLPIFLSIGYSACHWCHVMAHESFEDEKVAALLNDNFISIKVDREERPDIDSIYMNATVELTGHGGWPMSVFIDHQGAPFFAGTYFPPEPRYQMASFTQLLEAINRAWGEKRGEILGMSQNLIQILNAQAEVATADAPPSSEDLESAVSSLSYNFDSENGGFGRAPKFPPSMVLEFLLREFARTENVQALEMAERTLTAMACGGIYDQIGGGFARYSVDDKWVVPHFEKMLYDNALLLRVYTHWWRLTRSPLAQRIVAESAEFMIRELRTKEGGFASSLDADSEGSEGTYYIWKAKNVYEILGEEDGKWACELLNITSNGTFEDGYSTLQLLEDPQDLPRWERIKKVLFDARNLRTRPSLDDKVVAAWNGLAIAALAEAGTLFEQPHWIEIAEEAAVLLTKVHLGSHGQYQLSRTSRNGVVGSSWGVLDDYGNTAEGMLALYQVTGKEYLLILAGKLLDVCREDFTDGLGGFFYSSSSAPALVARPKNFADGAEPSGWLAVANALITYWALTGLNEYRLSAQAALTPVTALAAPSPGSVGWGLVGAQALLAGPAQIAIIGDKTDVATKQLLNEAWNSHLPGTVIAWAQPSDISTVEVLKDRKMVSGQPTAYLCKNFTCERPTNNHLELREQLNHRG